MKLSEATVGKFVISSIEGGNSLKEKLYRQGILPGKQIDVITCRKKGPCIIQVDETRVIIGSGMTSKIILVK